MKNKDRALARKEQHKVGLHIVSKIPHFKRGGGEYCSAEKWKMERAKEKEKVFLTFAKYHQVFMFFFQKLHIFTIYKSNFVNES